MNQQWHNIFYNVETVFMQNTIHFIIMFTMKVLLSTYFFLFSPIKGYFDGDRFTTQDDGRSRGVCQNRGNKQQRVLCL